MADYAKEFARAQELSKKQQEDSKKPVQEKPASKEKFVDNDDNVNNTDDAYKGAPRNRDGAWRNNNTPRGGDRGKFGLSRGDRGDRGRGRGNRGERGYRGRGDADRGNRRSFYGGNDEGQNGSNDVENAEGRPYRGNRGRGFVPRGPRGERGTRGGSNFRARGTGQYREQRGGRRSQTNEQYNEVEYQSDDDLEDAESSQEELTKEEIEFIEDKIKENSQKLKGIVNVKAIEQKCIQLDFDDKAFEDWVKSLIVVDVRGLADLEWNETVTKEQKHIVRTKTLAKAKLQAEKAQQREEREEKKRILAEERQKQQEQRDAKKKEREERKAERLAEMEANGEGVDNGVDEKADALAEGEEVVDEEAAPENDSPLDDKQKKRKRERRNKEKGEKVYKAKGGQQMQYQAKQNGHEKENNADYGAKQTPKDDAIVDEDDENYAVKSLPSNEGPGPQLDQEGMNYEDGDEDGEYGRKQSEDDFNELLAQTTNQHQRDQEEQKRIADEEQKEKQRQHQADERKREAERAVAEAKLAEKREKEQELKRQQEEKLKKQQEEEEEKRLAEKKKQDQAQNPNQQNQFMMNPLMGNPMMMGMGQAPFQIDKDANPDQLETQKQYFLQQMTIHHQMMQHFQNAYMQVAMQQQMMSQGGSTASSSSKNSAQFSAGKNPNEVPIMAPPNPMMGMMPGGVPNMGAGLGPDQQQFMPFQPFMPMMYPGAPQGSQFPPQNFGGKPDEK